MVEMLGGKIRCTDCGRLRPLLEFKMRLNRGRRIRSRWCNKCLKDYQHDYYNKRGKTGAVQRNRRKLSIGELRAIAADTRKGLAIAIDYNISLSTVYKVRKAYGTVDD